MKSKVPSHKFSKQLLGALDSKFFLLRDQLKTNLYLHILFLKKSESLYSYYLQSLQRLSTRVCKYFRPESLLGLSEW